MSNPNIGFDANSKVGICTGMFAVSVRVPLWRAPPPPPRPPAGHAAGPGPATGRVRGASETERGTGGVTLEGARHTRCPGSPSRPDFVLVFVSRNPSPTAGILQSSFSGALLSPAVAWARPTAHTQKCARIPHWPSGPGPGVFCGLHMIRCAAHAHLASAASLIARGARHGARSPQPPNANRSYDPIIRTIVQRGCTRQRGTTAVLVRGTAAPSPPPRLPPPAPSPRIESNEAM